MGWNPKGVPRPQFPELNEAGSQPWDPATNVELSQGALPLQSRQSAPQRPLAYNVAAEGFVNPFALTVFVHQLTVNTPSRVVPPNYKRCYLVLQNQGPGNVYLNFGQDVTVATTAANSNGMQLISKQFYEQIGGGDVDYQGKTRTYAFVSPDYVSVTTDLTGTTILVAEGVYRPQWR